MSATPLPGTFAAAPSVPRPTVRDTVSAAVTLSYRGLLKIRHHPQRLFDVVLLPVISVWLFSNVFGGAIAGSPTHYLTALIPGVMVQITITVSVATGVQLCEDIDRGVFDRFRSMPIARVAPLFGLLAADVVRYVIATVMTVLVGLALGYHPASLIGLAAGCVLVVFCAFSLSWIFAYLGVRMGSPSAVQGVSMLAVTPLTFLSNALVPTSTLPHWVRSLSQINPVSHICSAVRDLAAGTPAGSQVLWSLLGVSVVLVVMVPATVRAYVRKV